MAPAALLPLVPSPPHPNPLRRSLCRCGATRRGFAVHTAIAIASASTSAASASGEGSSPSPPPSPPTQTPSSKPDSPVLGGIANTRSWSQYYGSGFSIRVPPSFEDILEPEDYSVGMTYYGDKAKPRAYAARFASPDRDELISVVIKPSNQLKITFLEAKDISDLGTLKEASKIFIPAGAKVFSARTIKVKDEEDIRTYYFYEFGLDKQHVALMATVNSGKVKFGWLLSLFISFRLMMPLCTGASGGPRRTYPNHLSQCCTSFFSIGATPRRSRISSFQTRSIFVCAQIQRSIRISATLNC